MSCGPRAAGRTDVALYTGNDDSILVDLLTTWELMVEGHLVRQQIVGGPRPLGLLERRAVEQLERLPRGTGEPDGPAELLTSPPSHRSNAAVFDPENSFRGCISGILHCLAASVSSRPCGPSRA